MGLSGDVQETAGKVCCRRRRRKGKPATSEAAASNSPWPRRCLSFALSQSLGVLAGDGNSGVSTSALGLDFSPEGRILFQVTVECCELGNKLVPKIEIADDRLLILCHRR